MSILSFYMMGFERPLRKHAWYVFRPWENLWKADGTPQGVLAYCPKTARFRLTIHRHSGILYVSKYSV